MKIAIVHDYLNIYGGGERVLDAIKEIFPEASVYTILYSKNKLPEYYRSWNIKTSFLDKFPFKYRFFKFYVPFMPQAVESFDLSEFNIVISISAGFAKGVVTSTDTCHFAYTLTVPRFLWGYPTSHQVYHKKNIILSVLNNYLRVWDRSAADRVDYFIANSNTVKNRIKKIYNIDSNVIYSPVDENVYSLSKIKREKFFLIVSRLDSYKSIDIAIKACIKGGYELKIIGEGPEKIKLERLASGHKNIQFLGHIKDADVIRYFKSTNAVIFPGADDLGLVPIEAQLCGTPVIAYKKDGALETIKEDVSGVFFDKPNEESLLGAIEKFKTMKFDNESIRSWSMKFSKKYFKDYFKEYIYSQYKIYISK